MELCTNGQLRQSSETEEGQRWALRCELSRTASCVPLHIFPPPRRQGGGFGFLSNPTNPTDNYLLKLTSYKLCIYSFLH